MMAASLELSLTTAQIAFIGAGNDGIINKGTGEQCGQDIRLSRGSRVWVQSVFCCMYVYVALNLAQKQLTD